MITLLEGPAAGSYAVRRSPIFLRAVVAEDGERDVLDQIHDVPRANERVHVYELQAGTEGVVHLNGRGFSGFYAVGTYRYRPDVDGEALRDTSTWQGWATEERARLSRTRS